MIRHRPQGSGHPYEPSADQRVPVRPLVGERVELRVAAAASVETVTCEWDDGKSTSMLALCPRRERAAADASTEGHLAAAAAGQRGASVSWQVMSPPLPSVSTVRYRFIATGAATVRRTRWFDLHPARWQASGGTVHIVGTSRLDPNSVSWLVDEAGTHRVRFALRLTDAERVVGFGERFDRLDQRGHSLEAVVFEQYKDQGRHPRSYLPMPFAHVLGDAGWAFHVQTTERTGFDVGATDPHLLWIEADLGGDHHEALTVRFFDGSPGEILRSWLADVGRPRELPDWVFGLWASGNEWNTQARVEEIVRRHRIEDIPVSAVVIEAWSDESTFTAFRDARYPIHADGSPHRLADFAYPSDGAWPDPKGMVENLHEQDVRVLLWQIPLAKMRPPPTGQARADAETMIARGYGVAQRGGRPYRNRGWWFPQSLMPDFTNPEAAGWWLAKRRYLVDEVGIDGFKTDGGEHGWGEDLRYADGGRGLRGNNAYPVNYAAAYGELLRECGKAPVTFSRAGFTGSQAHGTYWAGDENSTWDALRSSLRAGLTAASCGIIYWGWDIAGFSGPTPDAELYLRATALSTFLPIMQYHSEFNHHRRPSRDRTPWNIAELTGDDRVLPTFRHFAKLRERLRPYLAEQARRAIDSGWPMLRPLWLADPKDPATWDHPYQYLLGDDLLVAPVTEPGATTQTVYLPPGRWVHVWNSSIVNGGRTITVPAPIDQYPVWCRGRAWRHRRVLFATAGTS